MAAMRRLEARHPTPIAAAAHTAQQPAPAMRACLAAGGARTGLDTRLLGLSRTRPVPQKPLARSLPTRPTDIAYSPGTNTNMKGKASVVDLSKFTLQARYFGLVRLHETAFPRAAATGLTALAPICTLLHLICSDVGPPGSTHHDK